MLVFWLGEAMLWKLLLKEMHPLGQVFSLMEKVEFREFILVCLVLEDGLPGEVFVIPTCFLIFIHLLMGKVQVVVGVTR